MDQRSLVGAQSSGVGRGSMVDWQLAVLLAPLPEQVEPWEAWQQEEEP